MPLSTPFYIEADVPGPSVAGTVVDVLFQGNNFAPIEYNAELHEQSFGLLFGQFFSTVTQVSFLSAQQTSSNAYPMRVTFEGANIDLLSHCTGAGNDFISFLNVNGLPAVRFCQSYTQPPSPYPPFVPRTPPPSPPAAASGNSSGFSTGSDFELVLNLCPGQTLHMDTCASASPTQLAVATSGVQVAAAPFGGCCGGGYCGAGLYGGANVFPSILTAGQMLSLHGQILAQ